MQPFQFSSPTTIRFGSNILDSAVAEIAQQQQLPALVISTGTSMRTHGYLDRVVAALGGADACLIFDEISPNPKLSELAAAIRFARECGVRTVVGLGGGSAIDAAKAVAVGLGAGTDDLTEYLLGGAAAPASTLPIIAIPTTAGTGSELSKGAILTSEEHGVKSGIRGDAIFPSAAIVDPSLTLSLPWRVTVESGFDAFAHAVETYVSTKATPITELLSLEALAIIVQELPKLRQTPTDLGVRERMSYAAMLLGISLANSSTCLPHRMQYAVGAMTDTSHGAGLAALFPAWIRNGYGASPEKFARIGGIIGAGDPHDADSVAQAVEQFLRDLDFAVTLTDLGVTERELPTLSEKVDIAHAKTDPVAAIPGVVEQIFRQSFGEELSCKQ